MKLLAFILGATAATSALLNATAQPRIQAAYDRRMAYECQKLGPEAVALIPDCANY